jgi:hypothetical protein
MVRSSVSRYISIQRLLRAEAMRSTMAAAPASGSIVRVAGEGGPGSARPGQGKRRLDTAEQARQAITSRGEGGCTSAYRRPPTVVAAEG